MNDRVIRRVLISVSDKTGIAEFAHRIIQLGCQIISTGGTLSTLRAAGIPATPVSDVTGFPEILDGRVKTLHPSIHAGLLAIDNDASHMSQLASLGIEPIDMLVVNLYPFERTIAGEGISLDEAVEQIDVGGPAMIRAAAKNFSSRAVVVSPSQYAGILSEMEHSGGTVSDTMRFRLACEAFAHTARYDAAIARYLSRLSGQAEQPPENFTLALTKSASLRYGENPHQAAALYGDFARYFESLHGKELSYNNIVDIQAAAELVEEFDEPTAAIIKHTNPCGVGTAGRTADAFRNALATDVKSAFGGIVCLNRPVDDETARLIDGIFTEVIVAPEFPEKELEQLKKKKDRRLIRQRMAVRNAAGWNIKSVAGGMLLQTPDMATVNSDELRVVTKRAPSVDERTAMMFAWRTAKHVKSNAIVFARRDRTVGIGAGQMSRVDACRIAVRKAGEAGLSLEGCAAASDAFFPFADGLLEAVNAGATAVIQPGGSVRDDEVIRAADEHDIAMIFTGIRHFRH